MIDPQTLLTDLTRQLKLLEDDLRLRLTELPALKADLDREWQAARDAGRCAETFEAWAEQLLTQAGVHWLLSCVFLRFIEDQQLVERPWLAGTPASGRLALAQDRFQAWLSAHPLDNDRGYLLAAFGEAGALPGLSTFYDPAHNPVFRFPISADAAQRLRQFWLQVDPDSGRLRHDFSDPDARTRFLGDLYQDLSEATRKRYALLQTPDFVEAFLLDRTLTPAIRRFGFRELRLLDPTCGSGHLLLGAFERLVALWQTEEPGRNPVDVAQRALDAVAGVDLNPFAVAIARFRLWVAALKVAGCTRLSHAPNFRVHVAIGDSLLHGKRFARHTTGDMFGSGEHYAGTGLAHAYASEDLQAVEAILGRQYHAVLGNPPYIVVRDSALNQAYRRQYPNSCHMKYSLGVPFTERFFEMALSGDGSERHPAGYVGLITTNSFMKREFGAKLIEQVLPGLDLSHVIDTAGAYIPGHGTPTVILLGRHQPPVADTVRTVMGIKGEPSTPADPAQGQVWTAILRQLDQPGSESEFVSVVDTPRALFGRHPWSIGGGGAAELLESIEEAACQRLEDLIARRINLVQMGSKIVAKESIEIGFASFTGADDHFISKQSTLLRHGVPIGLCREMILGDSIRDWGIFCENSAFTPYDDNQKLVPLDKVSRWHHWLWPSRTSIEGVVSFGGKTQKDLGANWWGWYRWIGERYSVPTSITFAFVATHNHFALDRGGKVFSRTAPVIKLKSELPDEDIFFAVGVLNSSAACFWMKQNFQNRGSTVDKRGARQKTSPFEDFYEFTSTGLKDFPLPEARPLAVARALDQLARDRAALLPAAVLAHPDAAADGLRTRLDAARAEAERLRGRMIALQEELDWAGYTLYGLLPAAAAAGLRHADPPPVALGERAFEVVLARRIAAGREQSSWFERHGSTPITELPAHWPADYRAVVERRIARIEQDRNLALIERPEYKRRWNDTPWAELEQAALREWLLDRLESARYWPRQPEAPALMSTWQLAEAARQDPAFVAVAAVYAGHPDAALLPLIAELTRAEAVPALPRQRYTDTGLRKRAQWEATWALQRREDAGEAVGRIPVPPKYQRVDFQHADHWRLRGALDVPKERWVSFPGCERGSDSSLPLLWAGWNPLQQAQALAAYYLEMKDQEGWPTERLRPLLASLQQLLPWLRQWHNDLDPDTGERLGDYYTGFVTDEARSHGLTPDALAAWASEAPPAPRRGRRAG